MTPEGRIKAKVKKLLKRYPGLYQHWPVLNGMGAPEVDCNVVYTRIPMALECKAPGKLPTPRQIKTLRDKQVAGVAVMVIRDEEDLVDLEFILDAIYGYGNYTFNTLPCYPHDLDVYNRHLKKYGLTASTMEYGLD